MERRASDGGAAEAPHRAGYEHVGDAIKAIKIKRVSHGRISGTISGKT